MPTSATQQGGPENDRPPIVCNGVSRVGGFRVRVARRARVAVLMPPSESPNADRYGWDLPAGVTQSGIDSARGDPLERDAVSCLFCSEEEGGGIFCEHYTCRVDSWTCDTCQMYERKNDDA